MNILLFGCGGNIIKSISDLSKENNILGLIDSNSDLHDKKISGYNIYSPCDIKNFDFDNIFITSMYHTEIYSLLIELGIEPSKIKVFRPAKKLINFYTYFYPLYGYLSNIQRMLVTMYNCKVFVKEKASEFCSFTAAGGITCLFYWIQFLNLQRFGFNGRSNFIGVGDYDMGRFWHLSYVAHFLYRRLGSLSTVIGSFAWLLSHFIWLHNFNVNVPWLICILIILLFSSYFYGMCFVSQNYNIFGWCFMPLGLYAVLNGYYWFAAIIWLFASFGSLTVVAIASWICIFLSIKSTCFLPCLTVIPALLRFAIKFFKTNNPKLFLLDLMKILGFANFKKQGARYRFEISKNIFCKNHIIFLFLWSIFCLTLYFTNNKALFTISCSIVALAILNFSFFRFADDQSIHLAMLSVASITMILTNNIILLISFYISIYISPQFISAGSRKGSNLWPRPLKPFKITNICTKACQFFSGVSRDSRVLIVSQDPVGKYDKILDGYRNIYELAFYAGNLKKILVFPDLYAVSTNNNNNSKSFWGTNIKCVNKNIQTWNADNILIYQPSNSDLDEKWKNAGFCEISSLDWGDFLAEDLDGEICWDYLKFTPKWFLLQKTCKRVA